MAEKKNVMTEVQALDAVLKFDLPDDVREKIEHMREVRSRKHEGTKDDSKRLKNVELGTRFAESWEGGTFKAADVAKALDVNTSKANAICKAMGWATVPTTEKVNVYTLA